MAGKEKTAEGGAQAAVDAASEAVVAVSSRSSSDSFFLSSLFKMDEKLIGAALLLAALPKPLKPENSPVCGASAVADFSSFFCSSSFSSFSGALTTGADPKVKPPRLKAGFVVAAAVEASPLPPMTKEEGGVLPVPPKIEGTSLLGGVEVTVVGGGAAEPKMDGFTGVAAPAAVVDSVPKIEVVEEGVPKIGVDAGFGESEGVVVAVPDVPNLMDPVPKTGVDVVEDLGVEELTPKVKPEDEEVALPDPAPSGADVPKVGVAAEDDDPRGVFVPKENPPPVARDPPKEKPPEEEVNFDVRLEAAGASELPGGGPLGLGV